MKTTKGQIFKDFAKHIPVNGKPEMLEPTHPPTHTPTPWAKSGRLIVSQKNGFQIADCDCREGLEDEVNAAFIVRTVNSHDELLREVKSYLNDAQSLGYKKTAERLQQTISRAEAKP